MPSDNSQHLLKVHRDNKPIYNSFWTLLGTTSSVCRDDGPRIPGDSCAISAVPGSSTTPRGSSSSSPFRPCLRGGEGDVRGRGLPTCLKIWIYPLEREPTLLSYQDKALTSGDSCFSSVFSPGEVVAWVGPKRKKIPFRLFSCSFRFAAFMPFLPALPMCPAQQCPLC